MGLPGFKTGSTQSQQMDQIFSPVYYQHASDGACKIHLQALSPEKQQRAGEGSPAAASPREFMDVVQHNNSMIKT